MICEDLPEEHNTVTLDPVLKDSTPGGANCGDNARFTKSCPGVGVKAAEWRFCAYLKNGGTLEKAAAMANHASTRTTQLYDRRRGEHSLDEVERIARSRRSPLVSWSPRVDYDAIAPLYDSQPHRARAVDPEFFALIEQRASDELCILDIGCGTGNQLVANRTAAAHVKKVGVDRSFGMLRQASPKSPGIAWVQADAAGLPFPCRRAANRSS